MKNRLKMGLAGLIMASIGVVAPVALDSVSAATGCTNANANLSNYFVEGGANRAHTSTIVCNAVGANGYKVRAKISCYYSPPGVFKYSAFV